MDPPREPDDDRYADGASEMSFPASDPPSYAQPTVGNGGRGTHEKQPRHEGSVDPTAHGPAGWPRLDWAGAWPDSQAYVHLVTQLMGKLRVACSPSQPAWLHTPLAVGARGLTTGPVPSGDRSIEVVLDIIDATLSVLRSDGSSRQIPLRPGRPVAQVWADYTDALRGLGMRVELFDKPQELADTTPLSEDHRPRSWDQASVAAWFAAMTATRNVFDDWRSSFFGRTGVQFWWGAFDLNVLAFNGRRSMPREGGNFIARYDNVAELLAAGFWPGDAANEAMFYGYIVPEPPGCASYRLDLPPAGWSASLREWVLPYEAVLTASDPRGMLLAFMDRVYAAAGDLAGWDLAEYRHDKPPRSAAKELRQI